MKKRQGIKAADLINALTHYEVEHVDFPLEDYILNGDGSPVEVYGMADDYAKKIYINKHKSNFHKRTTVVHELIHAVHYLRGDLDRMDEEELEKTVESETRVLMRRYFDGGDLDEA